MIGLPAYVKGREFHNLAALYEKSRPPLLAFLILGTNSKNCSSDCRGLLARKGLTRGEIIAGPSPLYSLCVMHKALNLTLSYREPVKSLHGGFCRLPSRITRQHPGGTVLHPLQFIKNRSWSTKI